jgi:hypothetical protein
MKAIVIEKRKDDTQMRRQPNAAVPSFFSSSSYLGYSGTGVRHFDSNEARHARYCVLDVIFIQGRSFAEELTDG